ncbi:MAG: M1 family metallopeptidase [Terricaulis sp.]
MKFRSFAVCLVLAGALGSCAKTQPVRQREWIADGAIPSRYEISIDPNDAASSFAGEETITVQNQQPLSSIELNAADLTITQATIDNAAATVKLDNDKQRLTLTPQQAVQPGTHHIHIVYSGKIYDTAAGLFRTKYEVNGREQHMLITQFEPSDARKLAPMWDQPNRRAVFSLTVTAPAGQHAISNMPATSTEQLDGGRTRTHFADTLPMASYLLFVGVGDIDRITTHVDGVEIGVITRRGAGERGRYALQAAADVLHYYKEYFGIPYPLPKLDMIGAPGAGGGFAAMENWGAILYFDQYLLLDEHSGEAERETVFGDVAHEIAHQWFGDLVTMQWWDDLWLNEGFASWMASKATEHLHPDWHPWLQQLSGGAARVMTTDARAGTHPVVRPVDTIDEANQAFDGITYDKGLAVIRMIEAYVGEEAFRTGVHNYLEAHKLGNSVTSDLWSAVQAASGQPVMDIAQGFTSQEGYPIVRASGGACNAQGNGGDTINIAQKRFALDDTARTNTLWAIPMVAQRLGGQPARSVVPAQVQASIRLAGCGPYILNAGRSAYFRVLYDQANLQALGQNFAQLPADDQLGTLLDYWAFARSGDAPFSAYLDLMTRTPANADALVAADNVGSVAALHQYSKGRASEASVAAWGRAQLQPLMARVGWTPRANEAPNETSLRDEVIGALGGMGDDAVIAEARRRVEHDQLPAGIRDTTLGVYAYNATAPQYERLVAQARAANDFVEQRRLWLIVAQAHDPALAQRTLDFTLTDTIPQQIRATLIGSMAADHNKQVWDFVVAHRAQIETWLEGPIRVSFPIGIASASGDPAMVDALETYGRNFPASVREQVVGAEASIRLRADTITHRFPQAEQWIAAHQSAPGR